MRFVTENFVPVAVDKQALIHAPDSRQKHADERKLLEKFTGGRTGTLAVHLLTPDGEPLTEKQIFRMQSAEEVLATLREASDRFGPVTPRRVNAAWQPRDKGVGIRPDGSVRLALTVRYTDQRADSGRVVFDSIVLTKEQWRTLIRSERRDGATYSVDEPTVREFSRAVSASSDMSNLIRPGDLSTAKLTGTVRALGGGGFEIRMGGELRGQRKYVNGPDMLPGQMQWSGVCLIARDGQVDRVLLVGEGSFKMPWDRSARPTAAVADWRAK